MTEGVGATPLNEAQQRRCMGWSARAWLRVWRGVLQQLLDENPEHRPIPLGHVAQKVMESCGVVPGASTAADDSMSSRQSASISSRIESTPASMSKRRTLVRILFLLGIAAAIVLVAVGGFLVARNFFHAEDLSLDDLYSVPTSLTGK